MLLRLTHEYTTNFCVNRARIQQNQHRPIPESETAHYNHAALFAAMVTHVAPGHVPRGILGVRTSCRFLQTPGAEAMTEALYSE